jgi:thioesterase domain-containing protein
MNLARQIPLAKAMRFRIEYRPPGTVRVRAPLAPNRNDKGTAFAGAIYSALVLAPWCLLTAALKERGIKADVMVYRASVKYLQPVRDDFVAECRVPDLFRRLARRPKRVVLASRIGDAAVFRGAFYVRAK